jgi:hypothetical protein
MQQGRRPPPAARRLRCKPTPDFFYLPGSDPAWRSRAGEGRPQAAAPIGAAALLRPGSGGNCVRPRMCRGCSSADAGDSRLHTAAPAEGPAICSRLVMPAPCSQPSQTRLKVKRSGSAA